jgi:hypothetical protein
MLKSQQKKKNQNLTKNQAKKRAKCDPEKLES